MRSPLKIISLATTLFLINSAIARAESQPPAELERLDYFAGSWRCQQPADSTEPSGAFTWNVRRDLNDFWYLGKAKQIQSPEDGRAINSQEFLGYNAASKKLVRSVVVGNGNSYNLTASDWDGNKLTWLGEITMQGVTQPLRQEIVKDSPDRFTATYFVSDNADSWQPVVDETCVLEQ